MASSDLGDRCPFQKALFNDPTLLVPRPGSTLAPNQREITVIPNRHHRWCPSSDSGHDHRATLQTVIPNLHINARRSLPEGYLAVRLFYSASLLAAIFPTEHAEVRLPIGGGRCDCIAGNLSPDYGGGRSMEAPVRCGCN